MRALISLSIIGIVTSLARADTKSEIHAQYSRFAKAYVKNDVKVMLEILSPDYLLIDIAKKEISYASYKAQLEKRKEEGATSKAYSVKILSLKQTGNEVAVETMEVTTSNTGSKVSHYYQDQWRKCDKSWLLVKSVSVPKPN